MTPGYAKGRPAQPRSCLKFNVKLEEQVAQDFHESCVAERRTRVEQTVHAIQVYLALRKNPEIADALRKTGTSV